MNIGVFGGTFDPPHLGHMIAMEHAREQLDLGKVLFVPASMPPHKGNHGVVEAHHRHAMLQSALRENRFLEVCDLEFQRGGVSYTVDTLKELKSIYPGDTLYFLLGMDMMAEFHTWRSPQEILELAEIVAFTRPDFPMPDLEHSLRRKITVCRIPEVGISSSDIRRRVKEGKSIRYMVVPAVEMYIKEHGLYR